MTSATRRRRIRPASPIAFASRCCVTHILQLRPGFNCPSSRSGTGRAFRHLAATVIRLVEARRVHIDNPLALYLPQLPLASESSFRIENLLRQTSGIETWDNYPELRDIEPSRDTTRFGFPRILELIGTLPTLFRPGTWWAYSSSKCTLLAALLEHAMGDRYDRYRHASFSRRSISAPPRAARTTRSTLVDARVRSPASSPETRSSLGCCSGSALSRPRRRTAPAPTAGGGAEADPFASSWPTPTRSCRARRRHTRQGRDVAHVGRSLLGA